MLSLGDGRAQLGCFSAVHLALVISLYRTASVMTRHIIVNSTQAEAVQAAARSLGAQCIVRAFGASELGRLKTPALIVFDSARAGDITPDALQHLRRSSRGGVRFSPTVVLCDKRDEVTAWRDAGAVACMRTADRAAVKTCMQEAMGGMRAWVTASSYVGPCRRKHKAVLHWRNRRTADQPAAKPNAPARAPAGGAGVPTASLNVLYRRISLTGTMLSGSTIESRRAFRSLVGEIDMAVRHHGRGDVSNLTRKLVSEAEAIVHDGQRDTRELENAIAELGQALRS